MIILNLLRRDKKLFKTVALQATKQAKHFSFKNLKMAETDLSTGVGDLGQDEVEVLSGEIFPGEEAKIISPTNSPTRKIETNPSTRTNLRTKANDHYHTRTKGGGDCSNSKIFSNSRIAQ